MGTAFFRKEKKRWRLYRREKRRENLVLAFGKEGFEARLLALGFFGEVRVGRERFGALDVGERLRVRGESRLEFFEKSVVAERFAVALRVG